MTYFSALYDAVDEFLSDLTVEDGCPVLSSSGSWSIIRSRDRGAFYLASSPEDYRDEVIFSARMVPDMWGCDDAFDPSPYSEDYRWLRYEIINNVGEW